MTPHEFIAKWQRANLKERAAAQEHFFDLCALLGQPTPAAADLDGAWYTFERGVSKIGGGKGWADVWMRERFAWEYKGKHRDLIAAYEQLLGYREDLEYPRLLLEFQGSVFGPWARYVCDPDKRGIGTVRYPRIVPKDEAFAKELAKRTLTNLHNERPTWLDLAHRKLDAAVFAACGWDTGMSDDDLLAPQLALNLERAAGAIRRRT